MGTYVPLYFIVDQYAPAYGNSWEEYFTDEEHINTPTVEALREELRTDGGFVFPVILEPYSEVEDDELPVVYDGMHRLLAYYLEEDLRASVYVRYGYPEDETPYIIAEVRAKVNVDLLEEDEYDHLVDNLSWRCVDGYRSEWVNLESLSIQHGVLKMGFWAWGGRKVGIEKIAYDVQERLGDAITVIDYRWWNLDEDLEGYLDDREWSN